MEGSQDEVVNHPEVRRLYLGEDFRAEPLFRPSKLDDQKIGSRGFGRALAPLVARECPQLTLVF
jgi:hypothetical protein